MTRTSCVSDRHIAIHDGPVMRAVARTASVDLMLDPYLWFVSGLALGVCVTGFIAVGSFDRGVDSVRRRAWKIELAARHAVVARRDKRVKTAAHRRDYRTIAS